MRCLNPPRLRLSENEVNENRSKTPVKEVMAHGPAPNMWDISRDNTGRSLDWENGSRTMPEAREQRHRPRPTLRRSTTLAHPTTPPLLLLFTHIRVPLTSSHLILPHDLLTLTFSLPGGPLGCGRKFRSGRRGLGPCGRGGQGGGGEGAVSWWGGWGDEGAVIAWW